MIEFENITYNKHNQVLDIYTPEGEIKSTFVYFHGGGLKNGDKGVALAFAPYLTERGIAVVSANYRMYPNAKFPDFLEDAAEAVAWVFNDKQFLGETKNIFVGGSSAGGYISMMLMFDKHYLAKHGIKPTDISGFIHDSGQPTSHFNVLSERGIDSRRVIIDETAPLYFIGTEETYPPMLFLVADNDMKNRYEQTILTLSTLKHFGYDESKIEYFLMHGKHCEHVKKLDEDGNSVFGKLILDYIERNI